MAYHALQWRRPFCCRPQLTLRGRGYCRPGSTIDITASRGTCAIVMTFSPDGAQQPHLATTVAIDIPQFDFKFHGKVSKVYNVLGSALHGVIKKAVESKLQAELVQALNVELPAKIAAAPTVVTVGGGKSEVALGVLVGGFFEHATSPLALSAGVAMTVGDAVDPAAVVPCPLPVAPLPATAPRAGDAMVQLLLADTIPSCVAWVFFRNGLLASPALPLGTTAVPWGAVLPALKAKFPGTPVVGRLAATASPRVVSSRSVGVSVAVALNLSMFVNTSAGLVHTDTLGVELQFGVAVGVRTLPGGANATLVGNVTQLNLTATVLESDIGPIAELPLRLFSSVFADLVRPVLNRLLTKGVPIAPAGGAVKNATVYTEDGFLTVAADFYHLLGPAVGRARA